MMKIRFSLGSLINTIVPVGIFGIWSFCNFEQWLADKIDSLLLSLLYAMFLIFIFVVVLILKTFNSDSKIYKFLRKYLQEPEQDVWFSLFGFIILIFFAWDKIGCLFLFFYYVIV